MSDDNFQAWLEMPVTDECMRKVYISKFTKRLYQFIQRAGYSWGISEDHLKNCIATALYTNEGKSHIESKWPYSKVNNDWSDDDLIHYNYVMDESRWEGFWKNTVIWSDVDTMEFRGMDRQLDIQYFIWGQLDLAHSEQTGVLEEILLGGDEEDDTFIQNSKKHTYDAYLQESIEYSGWGGYRK